MKLIHSLLLTLTVLFVCGSCNNEWEKEQFHQLVSFKSPLDSKGTRSIYIRYKPDGKVTFQLPLIVSGSTVNSKNLKIHIALDPDTLNILNKERFGSRTELFYKQLSSQYFEMPETVDIPAGESTALFPIDFSLANLDMVDKWVLPLNIEDGTAYGYTVNTRRYYRKALLRIFPFNNYSGEYGATAYKVYFKENETEAMPSEYRTGYVVNDNTIFFYAGLVDEDRLDRSKYKIFVRFENDKIDLQTKKATIYSDNPDERLNFVVKGQPSYSIEEVMDATLPYLKHVYVTLNLEYEYTDYTSVPGYPLNYVVKGTLTMERKINTQIPDEDQAIEW